MPEGWKVIKGAMTQPNGTVWISNGKSRFSKSREYENALFILESEVNL